MGNILGMMIESLVAALLLTTILYCVALNRRLTRLKADEQMLKATISELITATEIAERAIAGLKATVHECDESLGSKLERAEDINRALTGGIHDGDRILMKLARIVSAARPAASHAGVTQDVRDFQQDVQRDMQSVAAAAGQIATRAREHRVEPRAAEPRSGTGRSLVAA